MTSHFACAIVSVVVTESLAPDFFGDVGDELQLRPLLVFGDARCPRTIEAKPHCGLSASLLERHILRGCLDALAPARRRLSSAPSLVRDQSEHDDLALGHEAQRLERSRAFVVVFEQEPVDVERVEELLGDRVVAAFGVPLAAVVAAAQVDRQRSRRACAPAEAGVVGGHRLVEQRVGIVAHLGLQPRAPLRSRRSSCSAARRSGCTPRPRRRAPPFRRR